MARFCLAQRENPASGRRAEELPPIVILRLRNMTAIDATGLQALEDLAEQFRAAKRTLILCGAQPQPAKLMHQAEFEQHVGKENICENFHARSNGQSSSTSVPTQRAARHRNARGAQAHAAANRGGLS